MKGILSKVIFSTVTAVSVGLQSYSYAAEPIKVGMTVSSSGTYALASQSGERGVEVWVDDVNKRGGIMVGGEMRPIELVKRDDRSDKQMVARVYEELINKEKVDVLMAPFGSTLTAAAATITERNGKFLDIWSASSNSVYEQGFKYIVSATQMPVSLMPKAPIDLAAHLGGKKIAVIYVDEPYPAGLAKEAVKLAKEKGLDVVMNEGYPKGAKDFSMMIQKAKALGADVFFPAAYEGDQMSMAHQMRQMDISFPYTFMNYAVQPQFNEVGEAADYFFSNTNYHPAVNWKVTAGMNRDEFTAAYNKKFPDAKYAPDFQTILAYGAGVVLEEAIKKADSLEASDLKKAALDMSGELTVVAGPYEVDETGMQHGMPWAVIQRLPNNQLVSVWPENVANATPVYPTPSH